MHTLHVSIGISTPARSRLESQEDTHQQSYTIPPVSSLYDPSVTAPDIPQTWTHLSFPSTITAEEVEGHESPLQSTTELVAAGLTDLR